MLVTMQSLHLEYNLEEMVGDDRVCLDSSSRGLNESKVMWNTPTSPCDAGHGEECRNRGNKEERRRKVQRK